MFLMVLSSAWGAGAASSPAPGEYWKSPVKEKPGKPSKLGFKLRLQGRYSITQSDAAKQPTWLVRDDRSASDDYNTRRLRLSYRGQGSERLSYFVQVRRDWGATDLEWRDIYLTYAGWEFAKLTVGEMKTPFDREMLTSDTELVLAERPRAAKLLAPDRQIGVLLYNNRCTKRLGWYAGLFLGNGKNELDTGGSIMPVVRAEWLAAPNLNIGINWMHKNNAARSNYQKFCKKNGDPYCLQALYSAQRADEEAWGIDALLRSDGTSVWAGYISKKVSGSAPAVRAKGWYLHVGHYVPLHGNSDKLELVAGYDRFDPNTAVADQLDCDWVTIGANYHVDGHKRQWRLQYVFRNEGRNEVSNNTLLLQYERVLQNIGL